MADFDVRVGRRTRGNRRRGLSGLGLLLVVIGLLAIAVSYSQLSDWISRLWPLALVAIGVFGILRRPGWVEELDLLHGPQVSRPVDRPRRTFSLALIVGGLFCLPFTLGWLPAALIGPTLLVGLGLLLLWRRGR